MELKKILYNKFNLIMLVVMTAVFIILSVVTIVITNIYRIKYTE